MLPSRGPPHTELLDLDPLPLAALGRPAYVELYRGRFTHFNPIQTQVMARTHLLLVCWCLTALGFRERE
jgi:hypothetical protein